MPKMRKLLGLPMQEMLCCGTFNFSKKLLHNMMMLGDNQANNI
jgi:hypothetical protein